MLVQTFRFSRTNLSQKMDDPKMVFFDLERFESSLTWNTISFGWDFHVFFTVCVICFVQKKLVSMKKILQTSAFQKRPKFVGFSGIKFGKQIRNRYVLKGWKQQTPLEWLDHHLVSYTNLWESSLCSPIYCRCRFSYSFLDVCLPKVVTMWLRIADEYNHHLCCRKNIR